MNSHVRVLPSHRCTAMAPFRANGIPFSVAASRAQLRANGLKTFVLSPPAQRPKQPPRPEITRLQMRMNLCFRRKASRAKADFSFLLRYNDGGVGTGAFLPDTCRFSGEKKSLLVFTAFLCFFIGCFTTYGFCSIRLFPLLAPFEESRLRNAELFSSCAGA